MYAHIRNKNGELKLLQFTEKNKKIASFDGDGEYLVLEYISEIPYYLAKPVSQDGKIVFVENEEELAKRQEASAKRQQEISKNKNLGFLAENVELILDVLTGDKPPQALNQLKERLKGGPK